jgi:hypothetical protein
MFKTFNILKRVFACREGFQHVFTRFIARCLGPRGKGVSLDFYVNEQLAQEMDILVCNLQSLVQVTILLTHDVYICF